MNLWPVKAEDLCEIITVEQTEFAQTGTGAPQKGHRAEKLKKKLEVSEDLEREIPLLYYAESRMHSLDFVRRKIRQESEIIERIRRNSNAENDDAAARMRRSENRLAQLRRIEEYALSGREFTVSENFRNER